MTGAVALLRVSSVLLLLVSSAQAFMGGQIFPMARQQRTVRDISAEYSPGRVTERRRARMGGVSMMAKGGGGQKAKCKLVDIEDEYSDVWKLEPIIEILKKDGVGIIPTDTCYSFVTDVHSRKGVERLYQFVQGEQKVKKPLALLCSSISQVSQYTTALNFKANFKMLKAVMPGPYTFIFPSTNELPRMILEHKKHTWKRKEIGVRIPSDPVCLSILNDLETPLLVYGVPRESKGGMQPFDPALAYDRWEAMVDFVVMNGLREEGHSTTVVDMTKETPEMLREGDGDFERIEEFLN